jgi:hypothetical protein
LFRVLSSFGYTLISSPCRQFHSALNVLAETSRKGSNEFSVRPDRREVDFYGRFKFGDSPLTLLKPLTWPNWAGTKRAGCRESRLKFDRTAEKV